ncbi:MAG: c-type cytochrome biogenesis protein CcmF [Gammaproteobacteria bacterium]|nr:MAG: c-type cytochrome biogenesis protein CcmF [Gammaproteobacteria bacterium]
MVSQIGLFALVLALITALSQAVLPLWGSYKNNNTLMLTARPLANLQALFLTLSFVMLVVAFIQDDFSLKYVAYNSNTTLPLMYKISAVWAAHEGSLLLWVLLLSWWGFLIAVFSKSIPDEMVAKILAVMGLVGVGFLSFVLFTSNPFEVLNNIPAEGRDLNPLLQDIGLILHPPLLYMGYVGFSVSFAFAIAAMLSGQLDASWARWSRPWTTIAWAFLTIGIALGSWWAYYELGWGGWWFWDPVENASFMPWLSGTALIHSFAVVEKRGAFKAWTVLLAIITFSLCLMGTFLVRSGVLTSVHAFAADPGRGVFILIFLTAVIGSSLLLYSYRANQIKAISSFKLISRDNFLLVNNILLMVLMASILLGTLYPLMIDAMGMGKLSVGAPYFNAIFVPLSLPLAALIGIGVFIRWRDDSLKRIFFEVKYYLLISIILGVVWSLIYPQWYLVASIALSIAIWIFLTSISRLFNKKRLANNSRAKYGVTLAHIGVAVFIVGATLTSLYSVEKDVHLKVGESYQMAGFDFKFVKMDRKAERNYLSNEGEIEVYKNKKLYKTLYPQKRSYQNQQMPMTEAGIDAGFFADIFVAMGEDLKDGSWTIRLQYKPFVRWLWLGGLLMTFGGILAAADKRFFKFAKMAKIKLDEGADK